MAKKLVKVSECVTRIIFLYFENKMIHSIKIFLKFLTKLLASLM